MLNGIRSQTGLFAELCLLVIYKSGRMKTSLSRGVGGSLPLRFSPARVFRTPPLRASVASPQRLACPALPFQMLAKQAPFCQKTSFGNGIIYIGG